MAGHAERPASALGQLALLGKIGGVPGIALGAKATNKRTVKGAGGKQVAQAKGENALAANEAA